MHKKILIVCMVLCLVSCLFTTIEAVSCTFLGVASLLLAYYYVVFSKKYLAFPASIAGLILCYEGATNLNPSYILAALCVLAILLFITVWEVLT